MQCARITQRGRIGRARGANQERPRYEQSDFLELTQGCRLGNEAPWPVTDRNWLAGVLLRSGRMGVRQACFPFTRSTACGLAPALFWMWGAGVSPALREGAWEGAGRQRRCAIVVGRRVNRFPQLLVDGCVQQGSVCWGCAVRTVRPTCRT